MVHHLKIIFLHSINLILLLFIKVFLSSILRRPFYLGIKIKNNILTYLRVLVRIKIAFRRFAVLYKKIVGRIVNGFMVSSEL